MCLHPLGVQQPKCEQPAACALVFVAAEHHLLSSGKRQGKWSRKIRLESVGIHSRALLPLPPTPLLQCTKMVPIAAELPREAAFRFISQYKKDSGMSYSISNTWGTAAIKAWTIWESILFSRSQKQCRYRQGEFSYCTTIVQNLEKGCLKSRNIYLFISSTRDKSRNWKDKAPTASSVQT